jgi:cytosine/adenosine deaminase-related metal-dependent hydrolase
VVQTDGCAAGDGQGSRRVPKTLRARTVLTMHGPPLDGGWVKIVRGRVVAVGRRKPPGRVVDLGDVLLLPGLVNPHCHLEFSTIQQPLPPQPPGGLAGWIPAVMAARQAGNRRNTEKAILTGLQESAAAGVTAIGEIATTTATIHYPQRGVPRLRVYRECLGLGDRRGLAAAASLRSDLAQLPRWMAGISPHAPYSVNASLAVQLIQIAVAERLPVTVHLAESREEQELMAAGTGPFRDLFESLGVWPSPAPRLISAADWVSLACRATRASFIHSTFLDDTVLARLACHRDRASVVVCPRTANLISGTLAPIRRLIDAGIRVAVGTDGRSSAPDLSPRREAAQLVDGGLVSPTEALQMLTTNAAWAIGREQTSGRLIPNRPADITVLSPETFSADPYADAVAPTSTVLTTLRSGTAIFNRPLTAGSLR